jgi:cytochrome c peroxidase
MKAIITIMTSALLLASCGGEEGETPADDTPIVASGPSAPEHSVPETPDSTPPEELIDTDSDGIPDVEDDDIDGDGVLNSLDAFALDATESLDTDNDGIGNNADLDDDSDGFTDDIEITIGSDPLDAQSKPSDRDLDGIPDALDGDMDGDGVLNDDDAFPFDSTEQIDSDLDGLGNNSDLDDDNDGYSDLVEISVGTDPLNDTSFPYDLDNDGTPDSLDDDIDGDGVDNNSDAFPEDSNEQLDTDSDGTGNNADTDDDGDGYSDSDEITAGSDPLDALSLPDDLDNDGISDVLDADIDGDDVDNNLDAFPEDSNEQLDTDSDGTGNNADTDDDGDGYSDSDEVTAGSDPLDALSLPADLDNDGIPDLIDIDEDGDGVENINDSFPRDALETLDSDLDGIGNNADTDDDNDGYLDIEEVSAGSDPRNAASTPPDLDDDGIPDYLDTDIDGDGFLNGDDSHPTDPNLPNADTGYTEPTELDQQLINLLADIGFDPSELTSRTLPSVGDPLVELGKELFFSRSLSFGDDVACASCHDPRLAGTDNLSLPVGVGVHDPMIVGPGRRHDGNFYIDPKADTGPNVGRNSPTTFNIAFYDKAMFWDGRVEVVELSAQGGDYIPANISTPNGEGRLIRTPDSYSNGPDDNAGMNLTTAQARFPVTAVTEMRGFSSEAGQTNEEIRNNLIQKLIQRNWEVSFRDAFDDYVSSTESIVSYDNVALALGEYQRSQVALDNPFFQYLEGNYSAISQVAVSGAIKFFDEEQGGCFECHSGAHFSDENFYALATPQIGRGKNSFRQDYGRYNVARRIVDRHAFRTPSLLNTELTHPYMHAGALNSLEEAIGWHFSSGQKLSEYDFTLQSLPQFEGLTVDTSPFEPLIESITASFYYYSYNQKYSDKYDMGSANDNVVMEYSEFLKTLTSQCLRNYECVAKWMPDFSKPSPDGMRLEPVLSMFDNGEVFAVYPPDEETQVDSVFPDLSGIPEFPYSLCQEKDIANPYETNIISGFSKVTSPDVDRKIDDDIFLHQRIYFEFVLMSGSIASSDIDGDCDFDIVVDTGRLSGIKVFLNNEGEFTLADENYGIDYQQEDVAAFSLTDVNGDGWPDLFAGHVLTDNARLWLNNGRGEFVFISDFGFNSVRMTHNAAFSDIDSDGDLDLFTANWSSSRTFEEPHLWLNDGRGYFSEHAGSGISGTFGERDFTLTPNFADINGDGLADILSASDFLTAQVFQSADNGSFTNATDISVITDENAMGSGLGDIDNDGDLDWFISNVYDAEVMSGSENRTEGNWGATGNRLYRNDSVVGEDIEFVDVTDTAGVRDGAWGWGVCVQDLNNDGWLDIFHVNGFGYSDGTYESPLFTILNSLGIATIYELVESGFDSYEQVIGAIYAVFDDFQTVNFLLGNRFATEAEFNLSVENLWEGAKVLKQADEFYSEFYGTSARLFMNNQDGTFTEQSFIRGIADDNEGRGVVCNDFDRDGDIDILIANHTGKPSYYENHFRRISDMSDDFLNIRLHGVGGNQYAYGAKVYVVAGELSQYREMRFENNYLSNNAPELHFGLAAESMIDEIKIEWPDGQVTILNNIDSNQFMVIEHPSYLH